MLSWILLIAMAILIFPTQNSFASEHSVNWQFLTYDLSFRILTNFIIFEIDVPAITDSAIPSIKISDAAIKIVP